MTKGHCEACDYGVFLEELREEFPDMLLIDKRRSRLMRVAAALLTLFTMGRSSAFMLSLTTTVGYTIYTPAIWESLPPSAKIRTLRHERVHMRQRRRLSAPVFWFLYLFFPVPCIFAYCRYRFEREAYRETLVALYEMHGSSELLHRERRENIVSNFTSSNYFWTWPFRKSVERWYDRTVAQIIRR